MADTKRYYWLRLHDDFFDSLRIKKLRKMAGGDTYTIIYLKMQLKAIHTEGVLTYSGIEDDFASELALDIDESIDDVRVTLAYLQSCGLVECSDQVNFFLPYAVINTGSETASTQRSRECRERKKVLQYNKDATTLQQPCNVEKEIDIRDIKKENNKKKKDSSPIDNFPADVQTAIESFIAMRKKIKKPLADLALQRLCNKLTKLSSNPNEQIEILHQSEDHCWTDLYPLHQEDKSKNNDKFRERVNIGMSDGTRNFINKLERNM